jgi:hypothetical protein
VSAPDDGGLVVQIELPAIATPAAGILPKSTARALT